VLALLALASLTPAPGAAPARPFEERVRTMSWDEIVAEARGSEVFFNMWGGSAPRNAYVNEFSAGVMRSLYNVTVRQIPVSDTVVAVNKVLGERQAGKLTDGSVDLIWLNGENFRTGREGRLLFGPWADRIQNAKYVDWDDPAIAFDFGYPVEFYESPWGFSQFVIDFDSAKTPNPPRTIDALVQWVRANPGRFTYPAPPNFDGTAFITHLFYWADGGTKRLLGPFNDSVYAEVAPKVWRLLNDLKPALWRQGRTYPESGPRLQDLFASGEVWFNPGYGPGRATNFILNGRYPRTVRTYVFDSGTVAGANYLAIPFNTPRKAAAMVLANFLLSPEAQYEAMKPDVLGQPTPLSIEKLPKTLQDKFAALPRHEATLAPEVLNRRKLPQIQSSWITRIERDWQTQVLQRQ
jgi:putative spermidine/putrescine transport system substrate-binding protein